MNLKYTRANGSALTISLVFLFVLLVLGVSTMENSIFEVKMAHNHEQQYAVFQVADTAAQQATFPVTNLLASIDEDVVLNTGKEQASDITWKNELEYLGADMPSGYSFKTDGGGFVDHVFAIKGTAQNKNETAKAVVTRGVRHLGPN